MNNNISNNQDQQAIAISIEETYLINEKKEKQLDIKCPICHNIFINPIACANCLNHFCSACIRHWLLMNQEINSCPLCKNFKEMRCWPMLKTYLSNLQFNCQNMNQGCNEIIQYENFLRHSEKCQYKIIDCKSLGCNEKLLKLQMTLHLQENCLFVLLDCQFCKEKFRKTLIGQHLEVCLMKPIQCEECKIELLKKDKEQHLKICEESLQQCQWCYIQFKNKDLQNHELICENRKLKCEGCTFICIFKEYYDHKMKCKDFPLICNKCNQEMKRKDFDKHDIGKCIEYLRNQYQQKFQELQEENKQLKQKINQLEEKKQIHNNLKFSLIYKDIDILVKNDLNVAIVREHKKKRRDRFVLLDLEQPIKKNQKLQWKFNVLILKSEWFAVGITDETNVYLLRRYHDTGHFSYLISANGILYSSHDALENWQHKDYKIEQGDEIVCVYDGYNAELICKNMTKHTQIVIQLDMQLIESKNFYPCACLRSPGDMVKVDSYQAQPAQQQYQQHMQILQDIQQQNNQHQFEQNQNQIQQNQQQIVLYSQQNNQLENQLQAQVIQEIQPPSIVLIYDQDQILLNNQNDNNNNINIQQIQQENNNLNEDQQIQFDDSNSQYYQQNEI